MNTNTELSLMANNSTEKIKIDSKAASRSELINDLKVDFESGDITIQEASYNTLVLIVEYLNHYRDVNPRKIESPISENHTLNDVTDAWDVDYVNKMDQQTLMNVIIASEFMRIDALHKLLSAHISFSIRNLDSKDIIEYFKIEEDMTQEEMDKLEDENNELLMQELAEEEEKEKKKWEEEQKNK